MNSFMPTIISPFKYWVQSVLPQVYDDSLSYQELLQKVVAKLNDVITNTNNLSIDFKTLYDYVHNFFDVLDLQEEVNIKLDQMAESGQLQELVDNLEIALQAQINMLKNDKANKSDLINISTGSPIFVTASSQMTDQNRNYVLNGQIWAYDKTTNTFVNTNINYQSVKLGQNEVTLANLSEQLKYDIEMVFTDFPVTWDIDKWYSNVTTVQQASTIFNCVELTVQPGEIYNIQQGFWSNNAMLYEFLTSDRTVISFFPNTTTGEAYFINEKVQIPNNCMYLRINSRKDLDRTGWQVTLQKLTSVNYNSGNYQQTYNKIDKYNLLTGYLIYHNGVESSATNYKTTKFIPIKKGVTYYITPSVRKFMVAYKNASWGYRVSFTDQLISNYSFTATNDGWARISFFSSDLNTEMWTNRNDLPYSEGGTALANANLRILDEQVISPLRSKKLVLFGDSILIGSSDTAKGGFAGQLKTYDGMTVYNQAVDGATLSMVAGQTNSSIYNQIANFTTDVQPDFILFNGGSNDFDNNRPVGTLSPWFDYSEPTAYNEYANSMEWIIYTLLTKWPGTKLIYMTTHKQQRGALLNEYFNIGIEASKKWGIGHIDLYNNCGLNINLPGYKNTYTDAGGTHPNYLGYSVYYYPFVKAYLESSLKLTL